jgi:hypothetical protein
MENNNQSRYQASAIWDAYSKKKGGGLAAVKALEAMYSQSAATVQDWGLDRKPVLHHAAGGGAIDLIEYVLARGADINAKDKYGDTALHYAALNGHQEAINILIAKGADIHAKNNDGDTALDNYWLVQALQQSKVVAKVPHPFQIIFKCFRQTSFAH